MPLARPVRVPQIANLPAEGIDRHLRQVLSEILETHAASINRLAMDDITRVSAAATIASDLVLVDATATASLLCTLAPAADFGNRVLRVKRVSTGGVVMVAPQSGETIDGSGTLTVSAQGTFPVLRLVSDGEQWFEV